MNTILTNIQNWLKSKGGFTHVLVLVYLGALTAYASVPAFTTLINTVYSAMPAWTHLVIPAILGVIALYRDPNSPAGTAKAAAKIAVLLLAISILTLNLTACSPSTLAALVTDLGNSSASIAALEGNTSLATKLRTDTAAAAAAISTWKAGSPAQDVVETINIVEDDLNLFPVTDQFAPLIDLALGTAESIIEILDPQGFVTAQAMTTHAHRTVHLASPPKTTAQFDKLWKATAKANGISLEPVSK